MCSKKELLRFAHWAAKEVITRKVEDNPGAFCEIACRKLWCLGIVKKDGENWSYEWTEEVQDGT